MEKKVSDFLKKMGMNPSFFGYKYWKFAILEALDKEIETMEEVYKSIAKKYRTSRGRIEKNMRYALETSKARENIGTDFKVTNKVFFMLAIEKIRFA